MQPADEIDFAAVIAKTWRFYDKKPTGETVADWFDLLKTFPLDVITRAFNAHLTDPKAGQYLPKPADIIRHLPIAATDDGHPGPDEAWGILLRLIRDERETGVLTDEMRAAWQACQPILDMGDEVGARMCFLDVYRRQIQDARNSGFKAHWTVTSGTDPALRIQRLQEAVTAHRISADQARALLPGPTPVSLDSVAGLLEGPDASPAERQTASRFRDLAQLLRDLRVDSDRQWAEQHEAKAETRKQALAAAEAELLQRELRTAPNPQQKAA